MKQVINKVPKNSVVTPDQVGEESIVAALVNKNVYVLSHNGKEFTFTRGKYIWDAKPTRKELITGTLDDTNTDAQVFEFEDMREFVKWAADILKVS